jgi:folate-dependent phosphoribosylglycinamide formyltransferase PurN
MKVFILSNDDLTSHTIFAPLLEAGEQIDVVGLAFTTSVSSKSTGLLGGTWQLLRRMSLSYWLYLVWTNGWFRCFDLVVTRLRLAPRRGEFVSLRRLAALRKVPIYHEADFNSASFQQVLRESGAELLVIRVNQILKPATLNIPRHGVWCIHSSILPSYRGIAGEFHALRRGEPRLGSTVFRVEPQLDAGPALFQIEQPTDPRRSVYGQMLQNNRDAGSLLLNAVERFAEARIAIPQLVAEPPQPSYFGWPQAEQVRELHRRGIKLIRLREAVGVAFALGRKATTTPERLRASCNSRRPRTRSRANSGHPVE